MSTSKRVFTCLCCLSLLLCCLGFSVAADEIEYMSTPEPSSMIAYYDNTQVNVTWQMDGQNVFFNIPSTSTTAGAKRLEWALKNKIEISTNATAKISMQFSIWGAGKFNISVRDSTGNEYQSKIVTKDTTGFRELSFEIDLITKRATTITQVILDYSGVAMPSTQNRQVWFKPIKVNEMTETEKQTEQQKGFFERLGDRVTGAVMGIVQPIIDGVKNLFLPSGEFISNWFSDLQTWLEEHLGALYFPLSLIVRVFEGILSVDITKPKITLPEVKVMGQVLIKQTDYDFDFSQMPTIATLHGLYLAMVDVLIIFWIIRLLSKTLDRILGGSATQ